MFVAASQACASQPGHAPADPAALSWQQKPGAQIPLQTRLTDAAGRAVTLADLFGRGPVILDLGYFRCPSLCGVVRSDLFHALAGSGLVAGRDYVLISMSIDPAETWQTAAQARQSDQVPYPDVAGQADYLAASPQGIAAIAGAVGFRARYDARFRQFMHPAGLTILTSEGRVSSYLLGVGYSPGDLRAAVLRAGAGGIAQAALPVLLLCFHFDPSTGRYTLAIMKLLRLMGAFTVATLAVTLVVLHRAGRGARA